MAAQYVPGEVRDFILKHIASVAQIEALLLIWSSPEERWGLPEIAARIYTSETETAKALEGLSSDGFVVCMNGVFRLNGAAENGEMIRKLQEVYARYLIPVTDIIHSQSRNAPSEGRRLASKRIDEVPVRACSVALTMAHALRPSAFCAGCGLGRASGGLVRCAAVLLPKALSLRTADDGSIHNDLCQRRLVFGGQGLEGAGGAAESTAKEELCANE